MIFCTPSSSHLITKIGLPQGACTFKQFTDGEWHVTLHEEVAHKSVWILAQTGAPADNIVQLLLLSDALKQEGAQINLLITYFGYARQDRSFKGEPLAADLMCRMMQLCNPQRIDVIHIHNPTIGTVQHFTLFPPTTPTNHIPYDYFYQQVDAADCIVSPDKGARPLARHIAQHTDRQLIMLEKQRPTPEQVSLKVLGDVDCKRILIVDDMITTGRTVIRAAQLLYEQGARSVSVAATHGVFSDGAVEHLEQSPIERITVTNTLPHTFSSTKISVVNIASFLNTIVS